MTKIGDLYLEGRRQTSSILVSFHALMHRGSIFHSRNQRKIFSSKTGCCHKNIVPHFFTNVHYQSVLVLGSTCMALTCSLRSRKTDIQPISRSCCRARQAGDQRVLHYRKGARTDLISPFFMPLKWLTEGQRRTPGFDIVSKVTAFSFSRKTGCFYRIR